MKMALIDTNIISAFMRGNPQVILKFKKYLENHDT
jgi:predicted nucleic acid-binding protein